MSSTRNTALNRAMSDYGSSAGQAINPQLAEDLIRQQIAGQTLGGYEGVQAGQQQALGDISGVMDEWGQLVYQLGIGE